MSILKSTKTGFKYYYPSEWVKNICEMKVGGVNVIPDVIVEDDGIKISVPNLKKMRLMSKITRKDENFEQIDPVQMSYFLAPDQDCSLQIEKIPKKFVRIKEINCNVLIGNIDENSFQYLKGCKINGNVSSYYFNSKQLNEYGVHPNWGGK